MRFPLLLTLILFAVALAAGCGGTSSSKLTTVVVNLAADPETLDPAMSTGIPEMRVINSLLSGLTRLDETGAAQPSLATWESNDTKEVWTFHLREAQWTNGDPVTAHDFVRSWRRAIDPATAADYAYQLYFVAGAEDIHSNQGKLDALGVRAVNDRTLEVTLAGPTPFFPALVSHHIYYPVHASAEEQPDWHTRPESYVGNGAFTLVEWRNNERIVLDKNPAFWDAGNVRLDRIVFRMIEHQTTELAAYEAGELDMTYNVPRPEIPRLREREDLHFSPYFGNYYVGFNCARHPFDDPLVRKAFTLAVDREAIVNRITIGGEEPALAWVPPSMDKALSFPFRAEKEAYYDDADVEEARRLLAEAGYPGGKGFPKVRYIYNTDENHATIAQALQQMWREALGVEITLENQEWKTYLNNRNQGNFDISRAGWIADYPDPINFLDVFLSTGGNNNSQWRNAEYDNLLRQARLTLDESERFSLMHQAEAILMDQLPLCPIYYYTNPYLKRPWLKNVIMNGMGWQDLTYAYVERDGNPE